MNKGNTRALLIRDVAVLLLLLWAFATTLIIVFAPDSARTVYFAFVIVMDAILMVGYLGRTSLCMVLAGTLTCLWVSYKLYMFYATGALLYITDYALILMPLLGGLDASLFRRGMKSMDSENTMLRRQVEELVLIDDVTGLYNLRSLYRDLQIMVHYCDRNHLPISLMLVQMRYEQELRNMLAQRQYTELKQRLAVLVRDSVRVEDRAYCVDDKGTLAIILTTTERDSAIVRGRLQNAINTTDTFDGILDMGTKLDLRFSCKEYKASYGNDMMSFKHAVESELVYDV